MTTISHDSHNLIVCGTNDADMLEAAKQLKNIGGGIVVVNEGKVLAQIALEIAGLITARPAHEVVSELSLLHEALEQLSPNLGFNPFLTLSFLTLPVIPSIKLTDKGLFDVTRYADKDVCFLYAYHLQTIPYPPNIARSPWRARGTCLQVPLSVPCQ